MKAQIFSLNKKRKLQETKRILLVEDDNINRMLLGDYLGYCGYEVHSLPEASNFFPTVDKFKPDVILLDLKLPDIDGYCLLEQIQQKTNFLNIPIIVVSAFAFQADQERAINLGASRYFVKPLDLSKLLSGIEEELAQQRI